MFEPWVRKIPWRREWQPTAVFLPGESHGQRSLVGYSPWGHKESDITNSHFLPPKGILFLWRASSGLTTFTATCRRWGALLVEFMPLHPFLLVKPLPTGRSTSNTTTVARSWTTRCWYHRDVGPWGCSYLEVLWLVRQHASAALRSREPPGKVSFRHGPSWCPGPWAPDRTIQPVLITSIFLLFS